MRYTLWSILLFIGGGASVLQAGPLSGGEGASSDVPDAATEAVRPVSNTLTLQSGRGAMRDTYLTPLLYEGASCGFRYDRWRRLRSSLFTNQQTLSGTMMTGQDRNKNSDSWAARARYRYALHFGLLRTQRYTLLLGPYSGTELGFDYNLKLATANNPATVQADVTYLGGSLAAGLHYRIGRHQCGALLSLQAPLLGSTLMPDYGASYYETFYLDDYAGPSPVVFTSLHNQQNLDVRLTTDIPLAVIPWFRRLSTRVCLGMNYSIATMKVNDIVRRFSTFEAVVGWTYQQIPYHPNRREQLRCAPIEPW